MIVEGIKKPQRFAVIQIVQTHIVYGKSLINISRQTLLLLIGITAVASI